MTSTASLPADSVNAQISRVSTSINPNPAIVGSPAQITSDYQHNVNGTFVSPSLAGQQIFVYDDRSETFGVNSNTQYSVPADLGVPAQTIEFKPVTTRSSVLGIGLALGTTSTLSSVYSSGIYLQIFENGIEIAAKSAKEGEYEDMVTGKQIIFGFGDLGANQKFPNGLTFFANTNYTIKFGLTDFTSGSTYTIRGKTGYDPELSFFDGQLQNFVPELTLYNGIKSAILTGSGINSFWYTPTRPGIQIVKTEVYDLQFEAIDFAHFVTSIEVKSSSITGNIIAYNYTGSVLQGAKLSASAFDAQGSPLANAQIDFYIVDQSTDHGEILMGSGTTDVTGYASITKILDRGTYTLSAKIHGTSIGDTSTIVVPKLQVDIRSFTATGTYSSITTGISSVLIEGDVYEDGTSNPLEGIVLNISNKTTILGSVTTDAQGKFSIYSIQNQGAGTYQNVFTVTLPSSEQELVGGTYLGALTIYKGFSNITVNSYLPAKYHDQPVNITGTVESLQGIPLNGPVFLEYEDPVNQWNRATTSTAINGQFVAQIPDASLLGNYSYRAVYEGNTNYSSSSDQFTYGVTNNTLYFGTSLNDPSSISSNPLYLKFQEEGNFTVYVFDENGNPIPNMHVDILAHDYTNGVKTVIAQKITSPSGRISLYWTPTVDNVRIGVVQDFYYLTFQVNDPVNSYGYSLHEFKYLFDVQKASVDFTIAVDNPIYRSPSTVQISAISLPSGTIPVDFSIDVTISGITTTYMLVNGYLEIPHEFTLVQQETVSVEITAASSNMYYNTTLQSNTFQIGLNTYKLTTQPYITNQGNEMHFTGSITDIDGDLPVSEKTITIQIYTGSLWKTVGNTLTIYGIYSQSYIVAEYPGIYQYRVSVVSDSLYYGTTENNTISIMQVQGKMTFISAPGTYDYGASDTNRNVSIQLTINGTNIPIAFREIQIQFDRYSIIRTTNEQGLITFLLPQYISPGSYQLICVTQADATYLVTQVTKQITVNGGVTNLEWISGPPSISYYGQVLSITVRGSNETGGGLAGFTVRLKIGTLDIAKSLNSTGYASWNVELRASLGDIQVTVELDQQYNYNPAIISKIISHQKATLNIDLGVPDSLNSTYYGQSENYTYTIYWNEGQLVHLKSGTTVDIYWYDDTNGVYVWYAAYTLQDSGMLNLKFPKINAGSYLKLKWVVSHPDFYSKTAYIATMVDQSPINVSEEIKGIYAGDPYNISITITNQLGEPISGLRITILPTTSQEQLKLTDASGSVFFMYTPMQSGTISVQYNIDDYSSNYAVGPARIILLNATKRSVTMNGQFDMMNGSAVINYTLIDGVNNSDITGSLQVEVDIYNIQNSGWEFFTYNANGVVILFPGNIVETQYRLKFFGNSIYNPDESIINLTLADLDVSVTDQISDSYSPFALDMSIIGSQWNLEGMIVELHIYNVSIASWQQVASFSLLPNGVGTSQIVLPLIIGVYQAKIIIPAQGLYNYYEANIKLTVNQRPQYIDISQEVDLYRNQAYQLDFNLTNSFGEPIPDHIVQLYFWDTNTWIYSGTVTTNVSGYGLFTIVDSRTVGVYSYKIVSLGDQINQPLENQFTVNLWQEPILQMNVYSPLIYSDGGKIQVIITDSADGSPIANVNVNLYIQEYLSWTQIGNGITDINGSAIIFIQWDDIGDFTFKAKTEATSVFGSKEITATFTISPETAIFSYNIQDYGITNNKTITIWIADQDQVGVANLTRGTILWTIYTGTGVEYNSGILHMNNDYFRLVIDGFLIGNYSLQLSYVHDKGYYAAKPITISAIGFTQLTAAQIITVNSVQFTYTGEKILVIELLSNNETKTPLTGITVLVTIDGTSYQNTPVQVNQGFLEVDLSQLLPGTYNATIKLEEGPIVATTTEVAIQVTMEPGHVGFTVNLPENVLYDQSFEFNILDDYNSSSLYQVVIKQSGRIFLNSTYTNLTATIDQLQGYLPGLYIIEITRYRADFVPVTETSTIELKPKAVDIQIITTPDNRTSEMIIALNATLKSSEYPVSTNFTVTIISEGLEYIYTDVNGSLRIKLNGTGSFNIQASTKGYYEGVARKFVEYTFGSNTTQINSSTTTSSNNNYQNPDKSGTKPNLNTKGLETGMLAIIGLVGSGVLTTKNIGKLPDFIMNTNEKLGPYIQKGRDKYQQLKKKL